MCFVLRPTLVFRRAPRLTPFQSLDHKLAIVDLEAGAGSDLGQSSAGRFAEPNGYCLTCRVIQKKIKSRIVCQVLGEGGI